jgi:hypothetical protein
MGQGSDWSGGHAVQLDCAGERAGVYIRFMCFNHRSQSLGKLTLVAFKLSEVVYQNRMAQLLALFGKSA